jgi:phosphoribosylpyrophosphate synthetase
MIEIGLFTDNSNPAHAEKIAEHLGMLLGNMLVSNFSDGKLFGCLWTSQC